MEALPSRYSRMDIPARMLAAEHERAQSSATPVDAHPPHPRPTAQSRFRLVADVRFSGCRLQKPNGILPPDFQAGRETHLTAWMRCYVRHRA
jgi:hypothetical protein